MSSTEQQKKKSQSNSRNNRRRGARSGGGRGGGGGRGSTSHNVSRIKNDDDVQKQNDMTQSSSKRSSNKGGRGSTTSNNTARNGSDNSNSRNNKPSTANNTNRNGGSKIMSGGARMKNNNSNSTGRGGRGNSRNNNNRQGSRATSGNDNISRNRSGRRTNNNNSRQNSTASSTSSSKSRNKSRTKKIQYEAYTPLSTCIHHYTKPTNLTLNNSKSATIVIRGKLRVMPSKNATSFVTCDKGSLQQDVIIKNDIDRNRGLDGDYVYVELYPLDDGGVNDIGNKGEGGEEKKFNGKNKVELSDYMAGLDLKDNNKPNAGSSVDKEKSNDTEAAGYYSSGIEDVKYEEEEYLIGEEEVEEEESNEVHDDDNEEQGQGEMWQDDDIQMSLWDPLVSIRKKRKSTLSDKNRVPTSQRSGKVIYILPPKSSPGQQPSEFTPEDESYKKQIPKRTIVGTLRQLPGQGGNNKGGRYLLTPNNKSLPQFMCPMGVKFNNNGDKDTNNNSSNNNNTLYRAEYIYGSWHATNKWPPCTNVKLLCGTCNVQDETKALLVENEVDHGPFPPAVLKDVETSVQSGRFVDNTTGDMGWKPTQEMYKGRRDYRKQRIFTIDPTTAKDLDDALHITPLPDGRVEIGVHIADVSHFIEENSAVDEEALKRATTVYLVNDVIPMLPRPLCEIACSLNENVERLAFSCVWKMNLDGTLPKKGDIWYGRTVIKSCSRLDYATAQNIIDKKVANGEQQVDEKYWPKSRQPTGGHTIDEVAADVRLMHKVAMARRALRFENGALALNGIKLAFQLEDDGETPKLCAPYPLRDSNRLIEEFMLLANYLVAQRLITHAHGRALLRNHSPPLELGMQQVVDVSRESYGFEIDTTNSNTLQSSLSRLSRECDDPLVVQCVTESLMTPMRPAEYIAAGELDAVEWQHFALNIPYYTHFTSPIRRYPDVIVHRLLQATLDDNVDDYPLNQNEINTQAGHCNDMRMNAKKAQERSDRVFLSLYLKENPIKSTLGVWKVRVCIVLS